MQAFPLVNASVRAAYCIFYEYKSELCKRDAPALVFDKDMINCSSSKFNSANGGDAPECYQWYDLPGKCNTILIKSFI